jgi:hypothetical protein
VQVDDSQIVEIAAVAVISVHTEDGHGERTDPRQVGWVQVASGDDQVKVTLSDDVVEASTAESGPPIGDHQRTDAPPRS